MVRDLFSRLPSLVRPTAVAIVLLVLGGGLTWLVSGSDEELTPRAFAGTVPTCSESGIISIDTTWNVSCVHLVSSITISPGQTLTLEPGTIIKLTGGGITVNANSAGSGVLDSRGTAAEPIVFTSLLDDTVGGDTNGDGGATQPAVGAWRYISLADPAAVVVTCPRNEPASMLVLGGAGVKGRPIVR